MKISDFIVDFLIEHNIKIVFGYAGGAITHLMDSMSKNDKIKYIQTYHEQTASIAAGGYSDEQSTGVAMATSGPGATNLITGIADAFFDSRAVVFITGQVNTYEYKYNKQIRQQGFQETDIISIVKPITKYAVMVDKKEEILYELQKAFHIAVSGRPGPVLLDIPMNIQREEIIPGDLKTFHPASQKNSFKSTIRKNKNKIRAMIKESNRILILAGNGCHSVKNELREFIKSKQLPIVYSLLGKGVIEEEYPLCAGMIGSYGNRCANIITYKADLIIVLGARLDTRQTGTNIASFSRDKKIIRIDIDKNEMAANRLKDVLKVSASIKEFIKEFSDFSFTASNEWIDLIQKLKSEYSQEKEVIRFVENKRPYEFLQCLSRFYSNKDIMYTVDIGQNQMWSAQTLKIKTNDRFVTSGGFAPMGFSIPFAVGLAFKHNKEVIAISGDGGFHICTQALMLISQYNLDIKVVILNNRCLGMITQFQKLYFKSNLAGTSKNGGYLTPSIDKIAAAYNIPYSKVVATVELEECLKIKGARIIDIDIGDNTSVSPKLEVNEDILHISPKLPDSEYDKLLSL